MGTHNTAFYEHLILETSDGYYTKKDIQVRDQIFKKGSAILLTDIGNNITNRTQFSVKEDNDGLVTILGISI